MDSGNLVMKKILIAVMIMGLFSCCSKKQLTTVDTVNLEKYAGTWFEIARLPNRFEREMDCVTATYTLREDGRIDVLNKGKKSDKDEFDTAEGIAKVPLSDFPGQLKVSFFRPFWGDYYIIELADDYSYALIGDPSRKYLWVLARNPRIDEEVYTNLLNIADEHGFDISKIYRTKHDCQ